MGRKGLKISNETKLEYARLCYENRISLGEAGLEDRRGKRKVDQEPRSEVEELKIKMAQLEHELYMTRMERDLLKKVKELERKERYRK